MQRFQIVFEQERFAARTNTRGKKERHVDKKKTMDRLTEERGG